MVAERVSEELPTKQRKLGWVSAFVEARWFSDTDSPSWTSKLRVALSTGKWFGGVETTTAIENMLGQLWAKKRAFPEAWYGLKLTVYPDAKPQLELNPDPNCVVDPEWFRS
jgi:hypothetical protein